MDLIPEEVRKLMRDGNPHNFRQNLKKLADYRRIYYKDHVWKEIVGSDSFQTYIQKTVGYVAKLPQSASKGSMVISLRNILQPFYNIDDMLQSYLLEFREPVYNIDPPQPEYKHSPAPDIVQSVGIPVNTIGKVIVRITDGSEPVITTSDACESSRDMVWGGYPQRSLHDTSPPTPTSWATPQLSMEIVNEASAPFIPCDEPRQVTSPISQPTFDNSTAKARPTQSISADVKRESETNRAFRQVTLTELLQSLGLEMYYPQKLTADKVLTLSKDMMDSMPPRTLLQVPWFFLRNVMAINNGSREESSCMQEQESNTSPGFGDIFGNDSGCNTSQFSQNGELHDVHPLDLITVIFLCADDFLRQILAEKMAKCQFGIPLILPNGEQQNKDSVLLWSLRTIVREWKDHKNKALQEAALVKQDVDLVSFISFGEDKLKSKFVNLMLSPADHHHNFFWNKELRGGKLEPFISNGLVELLWYLPSGERSDRFHSPMAVTNLRGKGADFTQTTSLLTEKSTVSCLFVEEITDDIVDILSKNRKNKNILLVIFYKENNRDNVQKQLKDVLQNIDIHRDHIIWRSVEEASVLCDDVCKELKDKLTKMISKKKRKTSIEQIGTTALEYGFTVDEKKIKCSTGRKHADEILKEMSKIDVNIAKSKLLPNQGVIRKQIVEIEKEQSRLRYFDRNKGNKEEYMIQLKERIVQLRKKQLELGASRPIKLFIDYLNNPDSSERKYFLQWLKMGFDEYCQRFRTPLQDKYQSLRINNNSKYKKLLKEVDLQLTEGAFGLEHFFRELGQIYEANIASRESRSSHLAVWIRSLPDIAANALLDGYPLEVVDGDSSSVPIGWIEAVLERLKEKLGGHAKMFTLSTLGVQSSGKSTLLNTMFGLQFAVSSGRCTRGGYMQLVGVDENLKRMIGCDYVMVIDTEGLKSPQHSSIENHNQHDNELSTLVIGMSDITLINIAMESTKDMQDTLQIVVHALLRMNSVGENQGCHFVHQNVAALGAKDKTSREADQFLDDLNVMTLAAAKLERRHETKFTDVLEYDPNIHNSYVPGLWQGTPPMAPPNQGYSNGITKLRETLLKHIRLLHSKRPFYTLQSLSIKIKDLWEAIKSENFLFSFKNSLMVEAFIITKRLFGDEKWTSTEKVYEVLQKEKIHIESLTLSQIHSQVQKSKLDLSAEICNEAKRVEQVMVDHFETFEHAHLIECYRAEFLQEVERMKNDLMHHIRSSLDDAEKLQIANAKMDELSAKGSEIIKRKLFSVNPKSFSKISGEQSRQLFDEIWNDAIQEVSNSKPISKLKDIENDIQEILYSYLSTHEHLLSKRIMKIHAKNYSTFQLSNEHMEMKGRLNKLKKLWNPTLDQNDVGRVENHTQNIIRIAHQFLKRIEGKITGFLGRNKYVDYDKHFTQTLFHVLFRELDAFTDDRVTTTHQFRVDIAVYLASDALRTFTYIHNRYVEEQHPHSQLQGLKEQYYALFQSHIGQTNYVTVFCRDFLRCIIVDNIAKDINDFNLAKEMRAGLGETFNDHKSLQYHMMVDLAKQDTFENYIEYISFYEYAVKRWIMKAAIEHFTSSKCQGESRFYMMCKDRMNEYVFHIRDALNKACPEEGTLWKDYLLSFSEILQNNKKVLRVGRDLLDMQMNMAKQIDDLRWFVQRVNEQLANITEDLVLREIDGWDVEIRIRTSGVDQYIYDYLVGCCQLCPFCKAPCDQHSQDKQGNHQAPIHRPQGIGGYKFEESSKLTIDICPVLVLPSSDESFKNPDTDMKPVLYREYQNIYPEWTIMPNANPAVAIYWKWIFAKYQDDFAKHYTGKPADVPDNWHEYTWEDVKEDLEKLYHTHIK